MSKIYTRRGDKGETSLPGGGRVRKADPRIAVLGDLDELNAFLGAGRGLKPDPEAEKVLRKVQEDLFHLESVGKEDLLRLEEAIDRFDRELPPLRNFILPGGSDLGALLHMARAVCRRAERGIVALAEREPFPEEVLAYMNRLSDLLFVLARWANLKKGVPETLWVKR